jgi:hypothetical protein
MEETPGGPGGMSYGHLEELLKQNLEVAHANQKILKRMERNALIGFIARIVIWLLVLGVPLFILSAYIGPLMEALTGGAGAHPAGVFGLPSADQVKELMQLYKGQ